MTTVLEIDSISVAFGGVQALSDVSGLGHAQVERDPFLTLGQNVESGRAVGPWDSIGTNGSRPEIRGI